MLSIVLEEELKVLDFVLWLKYYYFVLLDCFPLFLHFLVSLIKFSPWNSEKAKDAKAFLQTTGRGMGGLSLGRPCRVLLSFNTTYPYQFWSISHPFSLHRETLPL